MTMNNPIIQQITLTQTQLLFARRCDVEHVTEFNSARVLSGQFLTPRSVQHISTCCVHLAISGILLCSCLHVSNAIMQDAVPPSLNFFNQFVCSVQKANLSTCGSKGFGWENLGEKRGQKQFSWCRGGNRRSRNRFLSRKLGENDTKSAKIKTGWRRGCTVEAENPSAFRVSVTNTWYQ